MYSTLSVRGKNTKNIKKKLEYLLKIHNEYVRCDLLVFDYYNGTETKEEKITMKIH